MGLVPFRFGTLPLLLAALAATVLEPAAGASAKSDRDREELLGPVKTVAIRWQANHKDSYGEVEDRELGSRTYDEAGQLLLSREYTADFIKEKRPERQSATVTVFRSTLGNSVEHYRFDAAGNMIEFQEWYGDRAEGPADIIGRMQYNRAGLMTQRESIDKDGKTMGVTLYLRDTTGRVTVEEDHPIDRRPPWPRLHYTYTLDAHGNWIERHVRRENVPEDDYDYRYAGNLFRTITYY